MIMDARTTALSVLIACRRQGAWSDGALKEYITRDRLSRKDAALATRLCYGVQQNKLLLDYWIGLFLKQSPQKLQPVVLDILRLGTYQLRFMDRIPAFSVVDEAVKQTKKYANPKAAGLTNAVLRAMLREPGRLSLPEELSLRYSHPQALVDLLRENVSEELLEPLLASHNEIPPICLQVNTRKTDREQVMTGLTAEGFSCEPHSWLSDAVLTKGDIEHSTAFREGLVFVQDASANLAVRCAAPQPGTRVLDCCAAPGGKRFAAALLMEDRGELISCDLYPHKLRLIDRGRERLGLQLPATRVQDAAAANPEWRDRFDLVIADVPCSGLGVIRKKPDIREKDLHTAEALPELQARILEQQAEYVKPGGLLLYSTCTILKRENEGITDAFLESHPEFRRESLPLPEGMDGTGGQITLLPCVHGTDGFYICKFRRLT